MSRRVVLRAVRLLVLVLVTALVVPASGVRPATIALIDVERAKRVDFSDGELWVLVLGSDAKGSTPVTEGRTDAIQLVGIDSEAESAVGIGIPRDTFLNVPGVGETRINEVYADPDGGPQVLSRVVEDLIGIRPDLVMLIGFEGFRDVLGVLGEVRVRTPQAFVTDGVVVRKGLNTFSPAEAQAYVRYRTGLTNYDVDRSANQQRLMLGALGGLRAMEDEVGIVERGALAAIGGVETDLGPADMYRLAQFLTTVSPRRVDTCVIVGDFVTIPASGAQVVDLDREMARRVGTDARDFRLQQGCSR